MNRIQKAYAIAKANVETAAFQRDEAERRFIVARGHHNPDGSVPMHTWSLRGLTAAQMDAIDNEIVNDEDYMKAFSAYNAALTERIRAEDALIDWSLSIVPAATASILNAHRNEYRIRTQMIDLAFRMDASTVPHKR